MTDSEQSGPSGAGTQNRRAFTRIKLSVPVEIETEGTDVPVRCTTSDLSLGGCYIETMFPFPAGTQIDLKLQIDGTLLIAAAVVTCDPQVGNGIKFVRMLPEDRAELKAYLETAAVAQTGE
jgi:c-di-GMP-binding flagellar brake protein YcgR